MQDRLRLGGYAGTVVQARLLSRAGYDAWNWQNKAMLRVTQFLYNLNQAAGG